jgi:hypothetical protein
MTLKRISQIKARMVLIEVKVQSSANRSGGNIARRVMFAPRQALSLVSVFFRRIGTGLHVTGPTEVWTYGMKRPMEIDQRILTGKRADVLQTIHIKDDNCPIQMQIVSAAEATRNQYCDRQQMITMQMKGRRQFTGGEACADRLIPTSTIFATNHIARIPERVSTLRKNRWLRAVFLMSRLYAIMTQLCDMKNNSMAASTVCHSH